MFQGHEFGHNTYFDLEDANGDFDQYNILSELCHHNQQSTKIESIFYSKGGREADATYDSRCMLFLRIGSVCNFNIFSLTVQKSPYQSSIRPPLGKISDCCAE